MMTMMKRALSVVGLGLWLLSGCGAPDGELEGEAAPATVGELTAAPSATSPTQATTSDTRTQVSEAPGGADCGECIGPDYGNGGVGIQTCCFNLPVPDGHGGTRMEKHCYAYNCPIASSTTYMDLRL